jgi:hypothetical protein
MTDAELKAKYPSAAFIRNIKYNRHYLYEIICRVLLPCTPMKIQPSTENTTGIGTDIPRKKIIQPCLELVQSNCKRIHGAGYWFKSY